MNSMATRGRVVLSAALVVLAACSNGSQSGPVNPTPGGPATGGGSGGYTNASGGASSVVVASGGAAAVGAGGNGGRTSTGGAGAGGVIASGGAGGGATVASGGVAAPSTSGGAGGGATPAMGSGGASAGKGGAPGSGGAASTGGTTGAGYVVAMVQSSKAQATDIDQAEIRTLVSDAIEKAGGLDFIKTGQTVVLKPNLLVSTSDGFSTLLPVQVNGITTDWRVAKAVAELVRAKVGPSGKILVMEGSTESTTQAFSRLGYTAANFGTDVDEFIALEGTSCSDRTTTGLLQKSSAGGKQFWINKRYVEADVVISLPVMKTHIQAGITGACKNLGIGSTPASQYAKNGCGRDQRTLIPHSPVEPLSQFIADYYSLRPADFVLMDALQGVQHGPLPAWGGGTYAKDTMNMRLILASRNAVALDTVESAVMDCNAKNVPHLTKLEALGLGTTDLSKISVVGKPISDVKKTFAGPSFACPGT